MKINELRANRAKTMKAAQDFLDSHRSEKGILSAEDTKTYEEMEKEIVDLGHEIDRQARMEEMEREMSAPVNTPLTAKPDNKNIDKKTGRASDEYKKNFWNVMRSKRPDMSVVNALEIGTDSEGGYLVPDEFERTLVDALHENNIFRTLAHVIQTTSGDRKIPVVASHGSASWVDEEGSYKESDDSFTQVTIGAFKLGTMIKVSEELLNDSAFDIESYISAEFARRIGNAEEEAFITGDGEGKPVGILADKKSDKDVGAEVGVTAASATAITADELIDLYHSLAVPYRGKAVWLMNDSTIQHIRKLKDENGQYLWQPGLVAGAPDTILGRPVKVSRYMPAIEAGKKTVAFGDFNYYWIADRQGRSFRRLDELFATTGQVGFRGSERVDGKLVLTEAIKVLQQATAQG
jgi:HK97 family phage major capsid protein